MRERLTPGTELLTAIRHLKLTQPDALSEFFDNSFGLAAGNAQCCRIEFHNDRVVITDNGLGIADMDAMFTYARSHSRKSKTDIGRFGVGAKNAMLHFGNCVEVQTVRDGLYHHRKVNWASVERTGQWPLAYRGKGKPATASPDAIRGGGTIITLSALHDGRRKPVFEWLCRTLTHRYRPAISAGRVIEIVDVEKKLERQLVDLGKTVKFSKRDTHQFSGTAAGRPFSVMATMTEEYDQTINGLHFAFGHRIILKANAIDGKRLPSLFYAEVTLGDEWKDCLSSDKTEFTRYRDELFAALSALLKEWLGTLGEYLEAARMEHINVHIEGALQEIFKTAASESGKHGPVPRLPNLSDAAGAQNEASADDGADHDEEEGGDAEPRPVPAQPGGNVGADSKPNRPTGIKYRRNDNLGAYPYRVDPIDGGLVIELNGKLTIVAYAYEQPFKIAVLWPLICAALANMCRRNISRLDFILPGIEARLGTSRDDPDDMEQRIMTWLLEKQPDIKEPAIEEVAA